MRCRHGYMVLMLVTGLAAPAGCCMRWQCFSPQMFIQAPPASKAHLDGDLTPAQAAQLCLAAGEDLEKRGFTAEAIRQLENARQNDPTARGVSRHLAVLYDLQGEATRSEAEYRRAVEEQPTNAELLNDFGYFHYRHNHVQQAENWLRTALRVDASCARAWVNLGQVLACQGRCDESYRAFAQVVRPAEAYSNVGVLLAKHGHSVEARRALEQAIALEPSLQQPRAFLRALNGNMPAPLPPGLTAKTPAPAAKPAPPLAPLAPSLPLPLPPPPPRIARTQGIPLPVNSTPSSPPSPPSPVAGASQPMVGLPAIVNAPLTPVPLAPPRPNQVQSKEQVPATPAKPSIVSKSVMAPIPVKDDKPITPTSGTMAGHKSPPAPPSPPPPPPPFAPPPPRNDEGPILIRTSAIEVQPVIADQTVTPEKPLPLPASLAATPLPTKRSSCPSPSAAPPQAVLTDCDSNAEPHDPK
jgi:Tfp pilus assembly protein PilF